MQGLALCKEKKIMCENQIKKLSYEKTQYEGEKSSDEEALDLGQTKGWTLIQDEIIK